MKATINIHPYDGSDAKIRVSAQPHPITGNHTVGLGLYPHGRDGSGLEVTLDDEARHMLIAFLSSIPNREV